MSFDKVLNKGVTLYRPSNLYNDRVRAFFSTRHGGVSEDYLASMNFSVVRGDTPENVKENVRIFADAIGVDYDKLIFSHQIHTDNVHIVTDNDYYKYYQNDEPMVRADALITDKHGIALTKFSADCTIVYLYDPLHNAIGLVHSGWRSTVMNITAKTIAKMEQTYGTTASDLVCAIAPCIHMCCFEVGDEVVVEFQKVFEANDDVISYQYANPHIDLAKACHVQLLNAGVVDSNIDHANICTACNVDMFFSHRATGGRCGLSAGAMILSR